MKHDDIIYLECRGQKYANKHFLFLRLAVLQWIIWISVLAFGISYIVFGEYVSNAASVKLISTIILPINK